MSLCLSDCRNNLKISFMITQNTPGSCLVFRKIQSINLLALLNILPVGHQWVQILVVYVYFVPGVLAPNHKLYDI